MQLHDFAMSNNARTSEMASHKNKKLNEYRERIDELEAEVERLREALASLKRNARPVLSAKEVHPRQWRALSSSIATARAALDAAEDGGDE